jgi:hypothetical protein
MAKTYRAYLPELLPPSLRDWLPQDHLVWSMSAAMPLASPIPSAGADHAPW